MTLSYMCEAESEKCVGGKWLMDNGLERFSGQKKEKWGENGLKIV
jgi:hypothetical protein